MTRVAMTKNAVKHMLITTAKGEMLYRQVVTTHFECPRQGVRDQDVYAFAEFLERASALHGHAGYAVRIVDERALITVTTLIDRPLAMPGLGSDTLEELEAAMLRALRRASRAQPCGSTQDGDEPSVVHGVPI